MSQKSFKKLFGKVGFQILAKIKMMRNKNWLFGDPTPPPQKKKYPQFYLIRRPKVRSNA